MQLLNPDSTFQFANENLIILAVILIIIRTLSNILPVFPGGMLVFSAIPVLGWFPAFAINFIGLFLGKSIAFFLARIYREPLVRKFASLKKIHELEKKLAGGKKEFIALLAFKLFTVPVVDVSSYAIGLTKISFLKFAIAALMAGLPTIASFYFGNEIYKRIFGKNLILGITAILIVGSIYFIIKRYKSKSKIKI